MSTFHAVPDRLHALLGEARDHLSPAHLERIETALTQAQCDGISPTLLAHLQQMNPDQCAEGTPWVERRLHAGRCNQMADASRALYGLSSVLRLLHAAHLTRDDAPDEQHLSSHEIDGLLHAARALAETSSHALHGRDR